jgi:hypothetical protein
LDNALHSLREAVPSFLSARKNTDRLVSAIPQLFRAVELLLKARLQNLDVHALDDRPNNPTVLKRLAAKGVTIRKDESETINRLRRLRNDLQHGTAKFNHRTGLALSRRAIVFLDRFSRVELRLWMGDAIPPDNWGQLLEINEVASTARAVVATRLEEARKDPEATISSCGRCGEAAMVRPHQRTGASCLLCGHVSVYREDGQGSATE